MTQFSESDVRRWRPQISLASVFVLMTACAVGAWYWYQRPYAVEEMVKGLDGYCANEPEEYRKRPPEFREVRHYRRLWGGGSVEHGPYRGYDKHGNLRRAGMYRHGVKQGEFIGYDGKGHKVTSHNYVDGYLEGELRFWMGNSTDVYSYHRDKMHGPHREWDTAGNIVREENYENGELHGPFRCNEKSNDGFVQGTFHHGVPSGAWIWRNSDRGAMSGQWRDGRADGRWEWRDGNGIKYFVVDFEDGLVTRAASTELSPRVIAELLNPSHDPRWLAIALRPMQDFGREMTVTELWAQVGSALYVQNEDDLLAKLKAAAIDGNTPVKAELIDTPRLILLARILKPHGLGYDVRFGSVCVDTLESIAKWRDPSGVTSLSPRSSSELYEAWNNKTYMFYDDRPLNEVVNYLSEYHKVPIDLSSLPYSETISGTKPAKDSPVTVHLSGVAFKNALAITLNNAGCKASIQGETIVVERQ